MVNNIEVIRVKRRVPAEKEEKQVVKGLRGLRGEGKREGISSQSQAEGGIEGNLCRRLWSLKNLWSTPC